MARQQTSGSSPRQERRKAATRAKIQTAAETLFSEKGYEETSIEEIAEVADVAVRTIYTHFPSKAAIMLAYFDSWVDAFVAEIMRRPVDEPITDTVVESLKAMGEAGWVDRVEGAGNRVHPLVEHLDSGSPDIAGHILQRWMHEMKNIADDVERRGDFSAGSLEPQARATAVFASWIAAMSAARGREHGRPLPENATGNSLGIGILEHITGGDL